MLFPSAFSQKLNMICFLKSPLMGRLIDYFKSRSMILRTMSLTISAAARVAIIFSNFVIKITSSRKRRKPTIGHALDTADIIFFFAQIQLAFIPANA